MRGLKLGFDEEKGNKILFVLIILSLFGLSTVLTISADMKDGIFMDTTDTVRYVILIICFIISSCSCMFHLSKE